jgi:hypothetical protein
MTVTLRSIALLGDVAELADAKVSKTFKGNLVWVRFPPSPPLISCQWLVVSSQLEVNF